MISFPLDIYAIEAPNQLAIQTQFKKITYAECATATQNLQSWLYQNQMPKKVAFFLPIDEKTVILFLALLRCDVLILPINNFFPKDQIENLLVKNHCNYIICSQKNPLDMRSIREIYIENIPWSELFNKKQITLQDLDIAKEKTLIFTSGSSGQPKGVLHSFANHYYSALGSNLNIPLQSGDRWLLSLPLYHVAGIAILMRCIISGATISIPQGDFAQNIEMQKITHVSMVATQLQRIIEQEQTSKLTSLRHILLGGSAIPTSLIKEAIRQSLPIHTSYGSTEMSSQIATTKILKNINEAFKAIVLPYRQVKVANDGEIFVKGETLCLGYLNQNMCLNESGWFPTGDYGKFIDKKYLQVLGRKDYMFISGGENIHPQEIEQALCSIPGVQMAVVVPIKNIEYGKRPVAFINTHLEIKKIKEELQAKIARFKIPDSFFSWPQNIPNKGIKLDRSFFVEQAKLLTKRL